MSSKQMSLKIETIYNITRMWMIICVIQSISTSFLITLKYKNFDNLEKFKLKENQSIWKVIEKNML